MKALNTLAKLLYKLKKEEVKSLINFLKYHQKGSNDHRHKSIELIQLLLSNKNQTAKDLQIKLYEKINYDAFNKLINRIKNKLYEILLFDSNLNSSIYYSQRNMTVFNLKKKLLRSEIMISRGMTEELENFQNKIISIAKKFEIYDSLIEALQSKQRYLGFRSGATVNMKIKYEIDFYQESRIAYNRALDIYNSIASKINFSSSFRDYEIELNEAILILKKDFDQTKSASIGYYYYLLLTESFQNQLDFENALNSLLKLKELILKNISIYTKYRIGTTILNIANNELFMYDFENCLVNADESIAFFSDSIVNIGIAKEIFFYGLLYSNNIDESETLIEELYHASRTSNTPFIYSKRAYLLACLKTFKGKFAQSNELLSEVNEIEKDKEGWNLGKRILTIINRIETSDFESADLQVQNLQKHIKRTLKSKHVRKRNIIILRILLKLINERFDFKKVYNSRLRYFKLLESNDSGYRWEIKSPELIFFHEWFLSKVENRSYNHRRAMEKEKEKNTSAAILTSNE